MTDDIEAIIDNILSRQECKMCKGQKLLPSDEDCPCVNKACSCVSCKK